MKTATKSTIRSTDELWQWAALKRSAEFSSKYSGSRSPDSGFAIRASSLMARGILGRLYSILKDSCRPVRGISSTRR